MLTRPNIEEGLLPPCVEDLTLPSLAWPVDYCLLLIFSVGCKEVAAHSLRIIKRISGLLDIWYRNLGYELFSALYFQLETAVSKETGELSLLIITVFTAGVITKILVF